ncbi:MAG: hypothetical protein ACHQPH_21300, partial [Reyranellales bacterium]
MRIASPPTRHSCFYGVDTPERAKLLAAQMSVAEMADYIKVDSLAFLSIDGLYRAMGIPGGRGFLGSSGFFFFFLRPPGGPPPRL